MEEKFNEIIGAFKLNGCRITTQRKNLISVILQHPGSSCKEVYYFAKDIDNSIGRATVYRTIQFLENLGYINSRRISIAY